MADTESKPLHVKFYGDTGISPEELEAMMGGDMSPPDRRRSPPPDLVSDGEGGGDAMGTLAAEVANLSTEVRDLAREMRAVQETQQDTLDVVREVRESVAILRDTIMGIISQKPAVAVDRAIHAAQYRSVQTNSSGTPPPVPASAARLTTSADEA